MEDELILVDIYDQEIGSMHKMQTHQLGKLHRAFSIFIVDGRKLLIQKRNKDKYHSGGKWANTCCSHPRKGEALTDAIHRRLIEEVGFDCILREVGSFVYFSKFNDCLYEYEYDHVFIGQYNGEIHLNPDEIEEIKWVDIEWLMDDMLKNPDKYAVWFISALPYILKSMQES